MPIIPRFSAREGTPTLNLPAPSPNQFGFAGFQAMGELADTFQRIQDAADEAEARRTAGEIKARMEEAIKQTDAETIDAGQFEERALERMRRVYEEGLSGTSNEKVKRRVEDDLGPDFIRGQSVIRIQAREKQLDIARANSRIFLEQAQRDLAIATDPLEKQQIENKIEAHLAAMARLGAIKPIEKVVQQQKILEGDAFTQAVEAMRQSTDPHRTYGELLKKFPNLDPDRLAVFITQRDSRIRQIELEQAKAAKEARDAQILDDVVSATRGNMTLEKLEENARKFRYDASDFNTVKSAMESGRPNNPEVETNIEARIRSGEPINYFSIARHPGLDGPAKGRLMALVQQQQDAAHFSKSEEYKFAAKQITLAIAARSEANLIDLQPQTQARLLRAYRELWERVGNVENRENPIAVADDIIDRIPEPQLGTNAPDFKPRYQTEQALIDAVRRGELGRPGSPEAEREIAKRAKEIEDWERFESRRRERSARPPAERQRR